MQRDVASNWIKIRSVAQALSRGKKALIACFPSAGEFAITALTPQHGGHDVFIAMRTWDEMQDLRCWLDDNEMRYSAFIRFCQTEYEYRIDRSVSGVLFRFADVRDAVHFKMCHYEAAPLALAA